MLGQDSITDTIHRGKFGELVLNKEAPHVQSRSLFIVISCFGLCTSGAQYKVSHSKKILYSTQQTSGLVRGRFTELTAVLVSVRPARTARRKAKSHDCTSQNNLTVKGTASWVNNNIIPASRENPPKAETPLLPGCKRIWFWVQNQSLQITKAELRTRAH